MPAMKREDEPKKKTGDIEVEEETPYVFQPYMPEAWAAYAIPKSWIYIPDDFTLEAVLADGKPKSLVVVAPARMFSAERRLDFPRVVQKVKGGYAVWTEPSELNGMTWQLEHGYPYRNLSDLIMNPASLIGMGLRAKPKSTLYYRVGKTPPDFESILKKQEGAVRREAEAKEREQKEYWKHLEEASARQKRDMGVRRVRTVRVVGAEEPEPESGGETEEENPLSPHPLIPQIRSEGVLLRRRRFTAHWGEVFLARLYDNEKGNYAVWSDISNTMGGMDREFESIYGYPAVFDVKYYAHYPAALEDYLTRRTQRRPVPLKGGG